MAQLRYERRRPPPPHGRTRNDGKQRNNTRPWLGLVYYVPSATNSQQTPTTINGARAQSIFLLLLLHRPSGWLAGERRRTKYILVLGFCSSTLRAKNQFSTQRHSDAITSTHSLTTLCPGGDFAWGDVLKKFFPIPLGGGQTRTRRRLVIHFNNIRGLS